MKKPEAKLEAWSMKNLLIQWELKRKTKRCARLPNLGEYAKQELKDLCFSEKPPNLVGNWEGKPKDQSIKNLLNSMRK